MTRKAPTMLRRTLLAGAGVSLALPLLHSLSPNAWGQSSGAYPKRLVLWWIPEGVVPKTWWPSELTGTNLSTSLAPHAGHRNQLSIIHGLDLHSAAEASPDGDDDHLDCPGAILTGGKLGPEARTQGGITIPQGRSFDRVLGPVIQGNAAFASYIVGCNNFHYNSEQHRQVSFNKRYEGFDGVSNPATAFGDLLANVAPPSGPNPAAQAANAARLRRLGMQKSVLDSVTRELSDLRCQVGSLERDKLDAHLDSIRTVEKQMDALAADADGLPAEVPAVELPAGAADKSYYTGHENFPAVVDLQSRILASGLAAGTTRMAVMAVGPGGFSPQTYPFAPLNISTTHHDLSHDTGSWDNQLSKINLWYEERLASFLDLLASIPEGDGSLLDNTLVVRFSELADGNHAKRNLPFAIAGMGGTFRLGQNLDAGGRPHNDLLTAVAQGFGLDLTALGPDAANTGPYSDILV